MRLLPKVEIQPLRLTTRQTLHSCAGCREQACTHLGFCRSLARGLAKLLDAQFPSIGLHAGPQLCTFSRGMRRGMRHAACVSVRACRQPSAYIQCNWCAQTKKCRISWAAKGRRDTNTIRIRSYTHEPAARKATQTWIRLPADT